MALLRIAVRQTAKMSNMVRTKLSNAARQANAELYQLQTARGPSGHSSQPIHPVAFRRQSRRHGSGSTGTLYYNHLSAIARRWLSSHTAHYYRPTTTAATAARRWPIDRSTFPTSAVSQAVARLPGHARAPFHTMLRPNLTGGALPRTQGGYCYPGSGGGSKRLFSHVPAQPAQQVAAQVGQACRAFWLGGKRARFDGVDPVTGRSRFRAVDAEHDKALRTLHSHGALSQSPGAFVDFRLTPTLTALSPLAAGFPYPMAAPSKGNGGVASLNAEGLLDGLAVDFARALRDINATMADVRRLASLGDLHVQLLDKGHTLRVRFPGLDADAVERLCDDVGVCRGIVGQDEELELPGPNKHETATALKFPFAPDGFPADAGGRARESVPERVLTSPGGSLRSVDGTEIQEAFLDEFAHELEENHWLSSDEEGLSSPRRPGKEGDGYESMSPSLPSSEDFEGLEGIYRFLEECDRAKARV